MSKSGQLRLEDVREVFRLVGDCRELGQDPLAWNAILASGLAQLFGAVMVNTFSAEHTPEMLIVNPIILGMHWADPAAQSWWIRFIELEGYRTLPSVQRFAERYTSIKVARRQDILTSSAWFASEERNLIRRVCSQEEFVYGVLPLRDSPAHVGLSINRGLDDRSFSPREQAQVRLLLEELSRLLGTRILLSRDAFWNSLSLRQQQILLALQTGDSEKEIGLKLKLSRHTVHDYVRSLYRRFGVNSRAELLSLCRVAHIKASPEKPD